MAKSVNQAFNQFNNEIVNLDPSRTSKAILSRDWLYERLNNFENKVELEFPFKYSDKHIIFGSFARKTKIRELDDVDIMFCFTANGATYSVDNNKYLINTENAGDRLKSLSVNGILNSKKVLNKFISSLSEIEQYKNSDLHRREEAAILNLISYEWSFDIVPCFYTDTQLYLIPDGDGNWKSTNPGIDQELVTTTNQNYKGKALQLIRTLKYWNRHNSSFTISSYLFEQIVINFISSNGSDNQLIEKDISHFFNYLSVNIYNIILDPKGIQGNINLLDNSQKTSISSKAIWAYDKSKNALDAQYNLLNHELSISLWGEIFGLKFPIYE